MIGGKIILIPAQTQEVSGKWRLYEWSANRKLFWGAIIVAVVCFLLLNTLFFHEYFYNERLVLFSHYGRSRSVDIEDATILDFGLWYAEVILYNIVGVMFIYAAIVIKHSLSKKFYIGAELWTERFTPLKVIEEKVAIILCQFLDYNQVLYEINKSDSTILIQGKNIHISYAVNKEKDVSVSITPIKPDSIFAKPEKYILPQDILYIIDIIEKAMVADNFMQQTVEKPLVTLIR
jgi:hypothetical protein